MLQDDDLVPAVCLLRHHQQRACVGCLIYFSKSLSLVTWEMCQAEAETRTVGLPEDELSLLPRVTLNAENIERLEAAAVTLARCVCLVLC